MLRSNENVSGIVDDNDSDNEKEEKMIADTFNRKLLTEIKYF